MSSPAFNPNASYNVPAFDPSAAFTASQDKAAEAAPADTRNRVQKFVDNLTTVTPEQEQGHSALVNKAQEFGAGAIQGFTQPIVHPLDTLSSMGHAIAHPIDTGKAMLQSAVNNPAQTAGNLVGGAVLGNAAGEVATPAINAGMKIIGKAANKANIPQTMYESALKPSTTLTHAERGNIVNTALENEIPVSSQGLEDLGKLINNLNDKVKQTIASDPNRPISPVPALNNLQSVRAKFANQVNPASDVQAIDAAGKEFADNLNTGQTGPNPQRNLTASEAQAMKQGTYQAIGSRAYDQRMGASVEAQKALARGLKEEIANQFPEISKLNSAESKLLDLQPVLERAVNRISNHQLIGIGTPIAGSAGAALTGSATTGLVVGTMKAVLDNPIVKSRLAIALSKAAKIPITQASARVQAYSTALGSAAGASAQSSGDQATAQ